MADYSSQIVQKLWNYCNVLRDDGMSYDDYPSASLRTGSEQLTYLLFLKMADERTKAPYVPAFGAHKPTSIVPEEYGWAGLIKRDGDELFDHYRHLLEELAKEKGLLALIFNKSQNKFQDPAKLRRLIVDLIDKENWSMMSADVKGDAYEGLLEKKAQDVKTGAGQYFTPRPLIAGIVDVMAPKPGETVCDPACGTGGFILAAHDYVVAHYPHMTTDQKKKLKENTFKGIELVQGVARLCAMNLLLHGIGSQEYEPIVVTDSLAADPGERFELVLTNPPFGKKSSITIVADDGKAVKERETYECEVHTLLRLPTGLFYAQGVKANVLFFDKKQASETPWTKKLWIYDLRTNKHFTLKTDPLKREDLDEFVKCYNAENRYKREPTWSEKTPDGRWRAYDYEELINRDKASLDIFWLRDESLEESDNLPDPDVLAQEIVEDLEAALEQFREIATDLGVEGSKTEKV